MDASSVTSSDAVRQPAASSSASVPASRAVAQVVKPARAKASAVARPMPVEQPVTRTVLTSGVIPDRPPGAGSARRSRAHGGVAAGEQVQDPLDALEAEDAGRALAGVDDGHDAAL